MDEGEVILLITRKYYSLFYLFCIILYSTMFLLIRYKTTQILSTMKMFLYLSVVVNFMLATSAYGTQVRIINNKISLALLCDGFCKYLGPSYCFNFYNISIIFAVMSCLINLHTLYYRTMSLKFFERRKAVKRTIWFSLNYSFGVMFLVFTYSVPQNHDFVRNETMTLFPEINYTPYMDFGGIAQSHHILMSLNTLILLAVSSVYTPISGYYWKTVSLKILKTNTSTVTSPGNKVMFEVFIKGLSFQVLLPLCTYVPLAFFFLWNKYSGHPFIISQFTLEFFNTLPCIFDPLLQIYFIMPYRTTIKNILLCRSVTKIPTAVATVDQFTSENVQQRMT